jgi:hypothetical protein
MKNIGILIFVILGIFLLSTCGEETQEDYTNSIETPKKTYLDTPTHTYKKRVEALSISNTLQNPVNTYLDSRVDAMGMSRKSLKEGNKRIEEQDKAMEALTK